MAKPAPTVAGGASVAAETPPKQLGPVFKVAAGPAKWADERVGVAKLSRPFIRKVFPDHWSFLLGEVALYSFVVLLLTGVFLTIWYKPSMAEVEYDGTYQLLRWLTMSQSYESSLQLSFDIRAGPTSEISWAFRPSARQKGSSYSTNILCADACGIRWVS